MDWRKTVETSVHVIPEAVGGGEEVLLDASPRSAFSGQFPNFLVKTTTARKADTKTDKNMLEL